LQDAGVLLSRPLSEWAAAIGQDSLDIAAGIEHLPTSHPVALFWRPRFEQTGGRPAQPGPLQWECLGHRSGDRAVIEWLPVNADQDEMQRQQRIFADFGEVMARLRRVEGLDAFLHKSAHSTV
jgi:hypothetical protein